MQCMCQWGEKYWNVQTQSIAIRWANEHQQHGDDRGQSDEAEESEGQRLLLIMSLQRKS